MTEVMQRNTEAEAQPASSMDGLHGRLVLANQKYLNPDIPTVPELDAKQITDFANRTYDPFENASKNNRRSYWQKEQPNIASNFDAMYQHWSTQVLKTFNDEKSSEAIKSLDPYLKECNIDVSQSNGKFTEQHAAILYSRYFRPQNAEEPQGVKKFVFDILTSHGKGGKLDFDAIEKKSEQIKWFSHIFGNQAAEMVKHLILAEGKLFNKSEFIKTTRKDNAGNDVLAMNHLSDDESRILRFISETSQPLKVASSPSEKPETEGKKKELPIMKHKEKIQELIRNNDNIIIVGHTGSGKTFMTSQFIYEMLGLGEKLVITEPRQINTEELAKGVAKAQGVELGKEVGFVHGNNRENASSDTKALFATEGTILRQLMNDPLLSDTTHIMVDEVHVRSKDTEQLLYYLKEAQRLRKEQGKPPLKIIAVSATVDKEELMNYFDNAKDKEVEGQTYEITPHFAKQPIDDKDMPQRAAEIVRDIVTNNKPGDIVIAVRGKADRETHVKAVQALNPDVRIIEIHRGSSKEEKDEVGRILPPGAPRRVIIGTDFIQTGVTINNLKHIINTGYVNQSKIDPLSGLEFIERTKQSQAEVDQWRGRVGRESEGDAYFLFTEDDYKARNKYPTPEMQRSDISDVLLNLKKNGKSFHDVDFLSSHKIDPLRIQAAEETLKKLGALDHTGTITDDIGKEMVRLPTNLRLARMIIEAKNQGVAQEACVIAAVSEQIENLFPNGIVPPALKGLKDSSSDFLSYLNLWKAYEESGKSAEWITNNDVDLSSLEKIERKLEKLYRSAGVRNPRPLGTIDQDKLGRAIAKGFADRVLHFVPGKGYVWELNNACNYNMNIDRKSALSGTQPEYIVFGENSRKIIDRTTGKPTVYVSLCHEIKP